MNNRARRLLLAAVVAGAVAVPSGVLASRWAPEHTDLRDAVTGAMTGGMADNAAGMADNAAGMTGGMGARMGRMNIDSEFAYLAEMIPHHEEAVTAAEQLLARTTRQVGS